MERLSERLDLPPELLAGAPFLLFNGYHQVWIENYKSILEYQDNLIRFLTKQGKIQINGSNLRIKEYTHDGMKVIGNLSGIEFLSKVHSSKEERL